MNTFITMFLSFLEENIFLVAILTYIITFYVLRSIAYGIRRLCTSIYKNVVPSKQKRLGDKEENKVKKALKQLDKSEYTILHDLMIPSKTGTAQIDHLVVSTHGFFVIETKNYSGSITGDPEAKTLYQSIMCKEPSPIHNPVFQNFGHMCAVQELLKLPNKKNIYSLVSFGDNCELHLDKFSPHICSRDNLIHRIEEIRGTYFTQEQVKQFVKTLKKSNITSPRARKMHIKRIEMQLKNNENGA